MPKPSLPVGGTFRSTSIVFSVMKSLHVSGWVTAKELYDNWFRWDHLGQYSGYERLTAWGESRKNRGLPLRRVDYAKRVRIKDMQGVGGSPHRVDQHLKGLVRKGGYKHAMCYDNRLYLYTLERQGDTWRVSHIEVLEADKGSRYMYAESEQEKAPISKREADLHGHYTNKAIILATKKVKA